MQMQRSEKITERTNFIIFWFICCIWVVRTFLYLTNVKDFFFLANYSIYIIFAVN